MRLILMLLAGLVGLSAAGAQETGQPPVAYIGFNTLKSDDKAAHVETFDDYVRAITPIMRRHGMTLSVYKVDHSDPAHPADFITFGTAKDQASFQAFFTDAEFQAEFPKLVGIIDSHFVTFTDRAVVPAPAHHTYTRLTLDWLRDSGDAAFTQVAAIEHDVAPFAKAHRAARTHHARGLFASTGLADDVAPFEAPSLVSLWQIPDPHGFLEDPGVRSLNDHLSGHFKETRTYWISRHEIGGH